MKKYTKKELEKIMLESWKFLLAQFILQNLNKDTFKFKKLLRIENLKDFLDLYWILENSEKSILKMNVSSGSWKFLKDYEKLWIEQKRKFLSENSDKLLLSLWENIQKNLV